MTWEIDSTRSSITFTIKHLKFDTVRGHFKSFHGTFEIDEQQPQKSQIEAEVQAAGVATGFGWRDANLRSVLFEVKKYPAITFKSTSVGQLEKDIYGVTGDFTMHGVTKRVTFLVHYSGQIRDDFTSGVRRGRLHAATEINRKDFNLHWNKLIEFSRVVGNEVAITMDLEVINRVSVRS